MTRIEIHNFLIQKKEITDTNFISTKENAIKILTKYPDKVNYETFDWVNFSNLIIQFSPQYFDEKKYNWGRYSISLLIHAPQFFNKKYYNWKEATSAIIRNHPHLIAPEYINWRKYSKLILQCCPEKLDINKAQIDYIFDPKAECLDFITATGICYFIPVPKIYETMTLKQIKTHALLNKI